MGLRSVNVNDAQLEMFLNKYKTKANHRIDSTKKLDGSSLPPCSSVLYEKIKRTCYISKVWMSSLLSDPPALSPLNFGWKMMPNNQYSVIWFKGESCPKKI